MRIIPAAILPDLSFVGGPADPVQQSRIARQMIWNARGDNPICLQRWPVMLLLITLALACIYRYGPSRDEPKWRWITWGSTFAALAWLGFSAIFSFYAAHFGRFTKPYGSLGAIIGFMTWMWLSVAVILLGAKLNAETEHQTARDSTEGSPKPLGARGAKMADTVGPSPS